MYPYFFPYITPNKHTERSSSYRWYNLRVIYYFVNYVNFTACILQPLFEPSTNARISVKRCYFSMLMTVYFINRCEMSHLLATINVIDCIFILRISNITMETAVESEPEELAYRMRDAVRLIESCSCPPGYSGLSCQVNDDTIIMLCCFRNK